MMIQPDAAKVDKPTDKAVGANRETNCVLAQMAKNALHYIQLAYKWEIGKSDVRKAKKRFDELLQEEKAPPSVYLSEAWRNRPYGCSDFRKAIDLYSKRLIKARNNVCNELQTTGMTAMEKETTVAAAVAGLDEKISGLRREIAAMEKRKSESKIQEEFPGAGGFRKQQQVSEKLRVIERREGGPLSREKRREMFPELERGWPDIKGDDIPLPFEKELKASERARQQADLENCNAVLNQALNKRRKAEAARLKTLSGTKATQKPIDRRHDPMPKEKEVRYVVQPEGLRPSATATVPANMPYNEGEGQKKRKMFVDDEDDEDDEDEEDDGAGVLPRPVPKQQKRSESPSLHMNEQFVPPEGQGAAYDILFREDDAEEKDPPAPSPQKQVESDHEFSDSDEED